MDYFDFVIFIVFCKFFNVFVWEFFVLVIDIGSGRGGGGVDGGIIKLELCRVLLFWEDNWDGFCF